MDTPVKTCDITDAAAAPEHGHGLQPFLHDACVTFRAPAFAVSRPDGGLSGGADGFYHGDRRVLSRLEADFHGVPRAPVAGGPESAERASFRSVLRGLAEHSADPAVTFERHRHTESGRFTETFRIVNAGRTPVRIPLTLRVAGDLAVMEAVKSGRPPSPVPPRTRPDGLDWSDGPLAVALTAEPVPDRVTAPDGGPAALDYAPEVPAGGHWEAVVRITVEDMDGDLFPAAAPVARRRLTDGVRLASADRTLDRWFDQSRADLAGLLLADPSDEEDVFLAAGAPWFLTLFGRDSLWAARMMLPLGTGLAAGTLRTLARRQGGAVDPATEEQPGKILHEVRRGGSQFGDGLSLPPCYFGTVDATPLWVVLLHDAWRWGLADEQVEPLLPHAESALAWMDEYGDADGDGFLEYIDSNGRGLSNQGWKDSGDAVRDRHGRLAEPPTALCEVQAYAYEAAVGGAALLRAFGRPGADRWQEWAERMRARFRARFWVEDAAGAYPAIALGRDKRPLDALTSNIGHLLGTGLLSDEESALVAARLTGPSLNSGFGLRTLAADSAGYNPLGYHIGSVWPHDTAVAVHGLVRDGHHDAAASLAEGLVAASAAFAGRLPELFGGHDARQESRPTPYPASCRPQAWAATAAVQILRSVLGLEADMPNNRLTVRPGLSAAYRPLTVTGLRLGGRRFDVRVDGDGTPRVDGLGGDGPDAVEVRLGPAAFRCPAQACPPVRTKTVMSTRPLG